MLNQLTLPFGLGLRAARDDDRNFTEAVFFSARDYFYQLPLDPRQVELLLKQQFELQQASYAASFPSAELYIVELHQQAIGKLMVSTGDDHLHIIDMVLMGEVRGKGYGSALLRALKRRAAECGLYLQLSVDQHNTRARKLYLNLGFRLVDSSATHDRLCW